MMTNYPEKIAQRAAQRFQRGASVPELAEYLAQALRHPELARHLLDAQPPLILPLQVALRLALGALKRSAARRATLPARRNAIERPASPDLQPLRDEAALRRSDGSLVRWLAGLEPAIRDKICTPSERREAIDLRRQGVSTQAAREILGCTTTELNRWTEEGRLIVLFKRVLPLAKSTPARFWLRTDLEAVCQYVEMWREEWKARKRARRTKMRLVASNR